MAECCPLAMWQAMWQAVWAAVRCRLCVDPYIVYREYVFSLMEHTNCNHHKVTFVSGTIKIRNVLCLPHVFTARANWHGAGVLSPAPSLPL